MLDFIQAAGYFETPRFANRGFDVVGVVQAKKGRSTHVEADGRMIHGRWFLDLDVFHIEICSVDT